MSLTIPQRHALTLDDLRKARLRNACASQKYVVIVVRHAVLKAQQRIGQTDGMRKVQVRIASSKVALLSYGAVAG